MTRILYMWIIISLDIFSKCVQGEITKCEKTSPCSCDTDSGLIDLSPIGNTDGSARFKDVPAPSGDKFSWNPCKPFTEGQCNNVASCQIQNILPPSFFNIGTQDSATFSVDATLGPQITYSADTFTANGNLTFLRKTVVTLVCDASRNPGEVTATGETPSGSGNYLLTLKSAYACEKSSGGGISVGSILLIIVFVTLVLYIASGVSIQKFVRKAEGKEMMPNYSFWSSLPGYVKDGCLFSLSLCGRRGGTGRSTGYNDI